MLRRIALLVTLVSLPVLLTAQTTPLLPVPHQQFFDNSGNPLSGGSLETYAAGTSTPKATYSDNTLGSSNPTTITLNSAGRPSVSGNEVALYLAPGGYKAILKNSAGTTIWTQDNITSSIAGPVVLSKTTSYTVTTSDGADVLVKADASGGAITVGLYTAVGNSGNRVVVKKTDSSVNAVTIDPNSTETMDGSTSISLISQYDSLSLQSDGTNWQVLARPPTLAINIAEGRLTAETLVPVSTSDQSAKTSIYYTPYTGNRISLYDGAGWRVRTFSEITISVAACTASKPYDVFLYDNAGTVTSEILVWTNDTARATALVRQDGVWSKTGALTRRYVGSFYCNASGGQTDDKATKRSVFNANNRVPRPIRVLDGNSSWTYTLTTIRQANADTSLQAEVMIGLSESFLNLALYVAVQNSNTVSTWAGFGEDNTTTMSTEQVGGSGFITAGQYTPIVTFLHKRPAVGRHYYAWLEASSAAGTSTWFGGNGFGTSTSGISGWVEA